MGAPMGSASLPPPHRPGSGGGMVGGGGGAREAVAAAAAAEAAVVGGEGGSGMVEIPDAIPAELSYDVRYEGEGADAEAGPAERLAVKLNKSQDLRVSTPLSFMFAIVGAVFVRISWSDLVYVCYQKP